MKLKVHAQRKFAQGAFIPPSASANTADRRVDVTPSKDENKNVYFNHMSAVSLLDMVAFKNMHTHTEPVVLLERLEEIQETIKDTPLPEINGGAKISPGVKNAMLAPPSTRNKPGRPFRYLQPKRTGGLNVVQRVQRPQNMHLRSRLGSSFKTRRPVKKKNRDKPNAVTRDLRRHRVPSPTESIYATDDEKPLTYIAQVLRRTVALRSDRNLRKRIGDELTSTSKRRARVPVPARTPKATKTSAQSGPSSKVTDRSSASDYDTDSGSIPSTPKQNATKPAPNQPAKPPSNASNGFKVNEGAGTSKQSESTQSPKEVENKSTLQEIAGSTLKPKPLPPVASSPSHTQTTISTPLELANNEQPEQPYTHTILKLHKETSEFKSPLPYKGKLYLLYVPSVQKADLELEHRSKSSHIVENKAFPPKENGTNQTSTQNKNLKEVSNSEVDHRTLPKDITKSNQNKLKMIARVQLTRIDCPDRNPDQDPSSKIIPPVQTENNNKEKDQTNSLRDQPDDKNDKKLKLTAKSRASSIQLNQCTGISSSSTTHSATDNGELSLLTPDSLVKPTKKETPHNNKCGLNKPKVKTKAQAAIGETSLQAFSTAKNHELKNESKKVLRHSKVKPTAQYRKKIINNDKKLIIPQIPNSGTQICVKSADLECNIANDDNGTLRLSKTSQDSSTNNDKIGLTKECPAMIKDVQRRKTQKRVCTYCFVRSKQRNVQRKSRKRKIKKQADIISSKKNELNTGNKCSLQPKQAIDRKRTPVLIAKLNKNNSNGKICMCQKASLHYELDSNANSKAQPVTQNNDILSKNTVQTRLMAEVNEARDITRVESTECNANEKNVNNTGMKNGLNLIEKPKSRWILSIVKDHKEMNEISSAQSALSNNVPGDGIIQQAHLPRTKMRAIDLESRPNYFNNSFAGTYLFDQTPVFCDDATESFDLRELENSSYDTIHKMLKLKFQGVELRRYKNPSSRNPKPNANTKVQLMTRDKDSGNKNASPATKALPYPAHTSIMQSNESVGRTNRETERFETVQDTSESVDDYLHRHAHIIYNALKKRRELKQQTSTFGKDQDLSAKFNTQPIIPDIDSGSKNSAPATRTSDLEHTAVLRAEPTTQTTDDNKKLFISTMESDDTTNKGIKSTTQINDARKISKFPQTIENNNNASEVNLLSPAPVTKPSEHTCNTEQNLNAKCNTQPIIQDIDSGSEKAAPATKASNVEHTSDLRAEPTTQPINDNEQLLTSRMESNDTTNRGIKSTTQINDVRKISKFPQTIENNNNASEINLPSPAPATKPSEYICNTEQNLNAKCNTQPIIQDIDSGSENAAPATQASDVENTADLHPEPTTQTTNTSTMESNDTTNRGIKSTTQINDVRNSLKVTQTIENNNNASEVNVRESDTHDHKISLRAKLLQGNDYIALGTRSRMSDNKRFKTNMNSQSVVMNSDVVINKDSNTSQEIKFKSTNVEKSTTRRKGENEMKNLRDKLPAPDTHTKVNITHSMRSHKNEVEQNVNCTTKVSYNDNANDDEFADSDSESQSQINSMVTNILENPLGNQIDCSIEIERYNSKPATNNDIDNISGLQAHSTNSTEDCENKGNLLDEPLIQTNNVNDTDVSEHFINDQKPVIIENIVVKQNNNAEHTINDQTPVIIDNNDQTPGVINNNEQNNVYHHTENAGSLINDQTPGMINNNEQNNVYHHTENAGSLINDQTPGMIINNTEENNNIYHHIPPTYENNIVNPNVMLQVNARTPVIDNNVYVITTPQAPGIAQNLIANSWAGNSVHNYDFSHRYNSQYPQIIQSNNINLKSSSSPQIQLVQIPVQFATEPTILHNGGALLRQPIVQNNNFDINGRLLGQPIIVPINASPNVGMLGQSTIQNIDLITTESLENNESNVELVGQTVNDLDTNEESGNQLSIIDNDECVDVCEINDQPDSELLGQAVGQSNDADLSGGFLAEPTIENTTSDVINSTLEQPTIQHSEHDLSGGVLVSSVGRPVIQNNGFALGGQLIGPVTYCDPRNVQLFRNTNGRPALYPQFIVQFMHIYVKPRLQFNTFKQGSMFRSLTTSNRHQIKSRSTNHDWISPTSRYHPYQGEFSRPRPTIRNDVHVGGGWVLRQKFLDDKYDHRVQMTPGRNAKALNDDGLDKRPIKFVSDNAEIWHYPPSTRADKSKYQMRTEALSSMNRATRAERMMAIATAERERPMTLDDALRECVLTAQAVTAAEMKRTQKRQVIPPKPHQISDTSYPSRRHATMKRVPHKVTVEELHRALEKACQSPPPSELDKPDAEAGPSKLRKKNCSESPPDPESTYNRKPEVESEPRRFRLEPTRPSAMARDKSISLGEMIKGKRNYEKYPVPLDTPPQFSDPEAGPSKVRKKKPYTTPDGPEEPIRISPDRDSPTPLVPPLRRKRTLLGMMRMRKRMNTPEPLRDGPFRKSPPKERSLLDIKSHDRPREPTQRQLDSAPPSKSVEHKAETPTKPTMSRLEPTIEPKSKPADIEIPADRIARCATSRRPIVEGWLKNVLYQQEDEKSPHFKVPRVPVARKSLERRPLKLSGNEREYNQTSAEPHLPAPIEIEDDPIEQPPKPAKFFTGRPRIHEFPCRENLPEPIIQPKNACLSKHYTTVRSIVHATDGELNDRCQHCVYCNRVDKIRKLSNLVQNQRKPATVPNEVYDFDADKEDSHENTRLYNFRQNRKAKILEPSKDGPKDPVYLDVLPPTNPHIIEITSVQMPNQSKPMLRARLIRKTDANLENEFSLIEHENLLDQLLEIKIANSDQTAKKNVTAPVEQTEEVAGPSNADAVQSDATDNTEDMELNYETDDSTEFLARLQTRLNTRKRAEQSNIRTKFGEKSGERSVEKSGGKSTEKTTEKVTEKLAEKLIEKLAEKLIEKAGEKSTEKHIEKPVEKSAEKSSDKSSVAKKLPRAEAKKPEPVKKTKTGLRKGHEETMRVELPKSYIMDHLNRCFREAPIFYPTEDEFLDPLAYFEKIYPVASQFGLCKVVAPAGFRPKCTITDDIRFNVANQYISRLYCRWGAASREMCAIKAYLAEQKVFFTRPPLIEGIELNLPKLYRTVQRHGGLKKVIEKKRWGRVAEDMRFPRGPRSAKRIDQLYVKHLLPYDTLSSAERRELMDTVENSWNRNYKKMLNRASNPLHRQKRLMGESESSDEMEDEDANLAYALAEAEDCVVTGRCMKLSVFKKVASNVLCTLFPNSELPSPAEVEAEYWALVAGATEHVCVNAASIDTGEEGYGFPRAKHDPLSRHPWNLKMFSQNSGNVLRSLGPVLGVTVPTLHLGMVFSTSCWHRDPHGLPWVEYMHQGPGKIWYGIPDELSAEFRKAVETLCPTSCQNKSIWLPSDITMIPPPLLHAARVPLSRVVQNPGEFIVVCPKAYSSSIATGYTESESVYFAPTQWLTDVTAVFQELRASCEPTMFSLEQLLLAVALDERVPAHVLAGVHANLRDVVSTELARRDQLMKYGVELATPEQYRLMNCNQARKRPAGAWNVREQDECEICRTTLYLSKVTGLTSKRSSLCLEHALLLLDKDRERYLQSVDGVVATFFVLHAELEDAVRRVKERMET